MFDWLRAHFRAFLASPSGTRFRRQHRRRQARPHVVRTILAVIGGTLIFLIGIVMLVTPGPGLLVMAIGAALIAGESLIVARVLDRIDFHASAYWARWRTKRSQRE
jgi:drug/metabolite transporter (DMT)-like permease